MKRAPCLSTVFLTHLPAEARKALESKDDLEEGLARMIEAGRAAWPKVPLDDDAFLAYVASHVAEYGIDAVRAGDLYIAAACAHGNPTALASFETTYFCEIDRVVAQLTRASDAKEEVKQTVRQKLFMGIRGGMPKIVDYSGRGDLRAWVRIVALRVAQDILRRSTMETPVEDDELFALADAASFPDDPDTKHLEARYRIPFRESFREAIRSLPGREQNVIRLHYLEGLNMEQIASIYRVHRITVIRWIGWARRDLLARTRQGLVRRLGVAQVEVDSIMRLAVNRIDLSIRTLLTGTVEEDRKSVVGDE